MILSPTLAACQADQQCSPTEACVRGQCTDLCDSDAACGINGKCRMENHEKQCTCADGFTGNPVFECIRMPSACQDDSNCPSGYSCQEEVCMPKCRADTDCAGNEKCFGGNCVLTCRENDDCFLGHVCLNRVCLIGCIENEDCSSGEACLQNRYGSKL